MSVRALTIVLCVVMILISSFFFGFFVKEGHACIGIAPIVIVIYALILVRAAHVKI